MVQLGILQGRLTPSKGRGIQFFPTENWREEFFVAKDLGISSIEWVFDFEDYDKNPLWTEDGCHEIKDSIGETGIAVETVCLDYFMRRPFYKDKGSLRRENEKVFHRVSRNLSMIGGNKIEVPLVDNASMKTTAEQDAAKDFLRGISAEIPNGVGLVLESDLGTEAFCRFLDDIGRANVGINYDLGDRVGCGYNPGDDIRRFGCLIENVHIKDKKVHGTTVSLGEGDVDFDVFFSALSDVGYRRNLTLQVARGEDGRERWHISEQIKFVRRLYEKYFCKGTHDMSKEHKNRSACPDGMNVRGVDIM